MVTAAPPCTHWWLVANPDSVAGSKTLPAVCKLCGGKRTFPTTPAELEGKWGKVKED